MESIEMVQGVRQIYGYLFGGLYDFTGLVRTVSIAKENFSFAPAMFLKKTLSKIDCSYYYKEN